MQTWQWLYNSESPFIWRFIRNVIIKAAILFIILNALFAILEPLPFLGKISAYNVLFEGRDRLPYGENPDASYNLSLYQIDAMFASQKLAGADNDDEYRVLLIGDSSVWGFLLEPDDTLAAQINRGDYRTADGERVRAYNVGYPTMSLIKDLMLLDYAMRYDPDLIVWLFTLESFDQADQLDTSFVQNNADTIRGLIETYNLNQDTDDARFVDHSLWEKTIMKQRRALADVLRLQLYGLAWTVTGIDQEYPDDYTPRAVDLLADETWHDTYEPGSLTADDLAFDILRAGVQRSGDTPIVLLNEPMFISEGENSDIRYNAFYPRWAYDAYREWLVDYVADQDWEFVDLWDAIPNVDCYTDSAVHLTPECSTQLGSIVGTLITQMADTGTVVPR